MELPLPSTPSSSSTAGTQRTGSGSGYGYSTGKRRSSAPPPARSCESDDAEPAAYIDAVKLVLQGASVEAASALRHCNCVTNLRKEILELLRRPSAGLPCCAEELVSLGEAAAEAEELEELIRRHWPIRDERQVVQQRLALRNILSPQALLRVIGLRGPGRCYLNEMLSEAGIRAIRPQVVEDLVADLTMRVRQCLEVSEEGPRPVLVTAPHNVFLLRDGESPHVMEEYTTLIAQRLARQLGGTVLSWSRSEQYRTELLWSLARHQGQDVNPGALLDPRNRDPNYLAAEELTQNLWFQQVSRLADLWRDSLGNKRPIFHVDVHGCRDPPDTPSHLTVGLAAMRHEADSGRGPLSPARFEAFVLALEAELSSALRCLDLRPKATLVRVLSPSLADGAERLAGAWPAKLRRFTQSQQAVNFAKFTHSCQLEMSKSLRKVLSKNDKASISIGKALNKAWTSALNLNLPALTTSLSSGEHGAASVSDKSALSWPPHRSRRSASRPLARKLGAVPPRRGSSEVRAAVSNEYM